MYENNHEGWLFLNLILLKYVDGREMHYGINEQVMELIWIAVSSHRI